MQSTNNRNYKNADRLMIISIVVSMFPCAIRSDYNMCLMMYSIIIWRWKNNTAIDVRMMILPLLIVGIIYDIVWSVYRYSFFIYDDKLNISAAVKLTVYIIGLVMIILKVIISYLVWRSGYLNSSRYILIIRY